MDVNAMQFGEIPRSYGAIQSNNYHREATGSNLDMNSFLQLLAAQFENQDVMNPTDNTQFISELAQFSSLQAMTTMTQTATKQYAASLVGKTVKLYAYDTAGKAVEKTGAVQGVTFTSNGGAALVVDNTTYDIGAVEQVVDPQNPPKTTASSGSTTGGATGTGGSTGGTTGSNTNTENGGSTGGTSTGGGTTGT